MLWNIRRGSESRRRYVARAVTGFDSRPRVILSCGHLSCGKESPFPTQEHGRNTPLEKLPPNRSSNLNNCGLLSFSRSRQIITSYDNINNNINKDAYYTDCFHNVVDFIQRIRVESWNQFRWIDVNLLSRLDKILRLNIFILKIYTRELYAHIKYLKLNIIMWYSVCRNAKIIKTNIRVLPQLLRMRYY